MLQARCYTPCNKGTHMPRKLENILISLRDEKTTNLSHKEQEKLLQHAAHEARYRVRDFAQKMHAQRIDKYLCTPKA